MFRWKNSYTRILCITLIASSILSIIYYLYFSSNEVYFHDEDYATNSHTIQLCKWEPTMPVFFNVKTHLGVNYDAGHWFHMAENLMVEHSILRKKNELANDSLVFYNFDKHNFIDNLNSITRFIVYLGTIAPSAKISSLNFMENPSLWSKRNLKVGDAVYVDYHGFMKHNMQSIPLSTDIIPAKRFSPSSDYNIRSAIKLSENTRICIKYAGTLGGRWPTPQRGSWYPNEGDIATFRQKIKEACPKNSELLAKFAKKKKFKLVIYQRDLSRKLANEAEALNMLQTALPTNDWEIEVLMHSSQRSPCELAHILQDVDVLLTPHGFQSMLLLFLPRPSLLFEIFPYKYYKRGYGPFSGEYGIVHSGVMSPATLWHTNLFLSFIKTSTCMQSKFCRGYARNQDVLFTQNGVNKLVEQIKLNVNKWSIDLEKNNKSQKKKLIDFHETLYSR